jgi:hypothetical protein
MTPEPLSRLLHNHSNIHLYIQTYLANCSLIYILLYVFSVGRAILLEFSWGPFLLLICPSFFAILPTPACWYLAQP